MPLTQSQRNKNWYYKNLEKNRAYFKARYDYTKVKESWPKNECQHCHQSYKGSGEKYCSQNCAGLAFVGFKHTEEAKQKVSLSLLGQQRHRSPHTEETKQKISKARLGQNKGQKNYRWISDRTKLVKRQERNDSQYQDWRRQVWERDGFKCKMANSDCNGRIEAHHILAWSAYPELRYEINNGITLCHAHHPRKRIEEKQLAPIFQELVKG